MDFTFDEATLAAQDIVLTLGERLLPWEVVASAEHEAEGIVLDAAKAVHAAGVPEAFLGQDDDALGTEALAAVLRAEGLRGSMLGLLTRLGFGVAFLARVDGARAAETAAGAADGSRLVTAAVSEPGGFGLRDCRTRAVEIDGGYCLDGSKSLIPDATRADVVLVPARLPDDSIAVFMVPTDTDGVVAAPQPTGCHLQAGSMTLDSVRVAADDLLRVNNSIEEGARLLDQVARLSVLATGSGLLATAMNLTGEHVRTRRQFGRALAEFQYVSVRMGDMYLAEFAIDSTVRAAAWAMQTGEGDQAEEYLAAAATTYCREGLASVMIGQQLHGGTGLDLDHPYHRILTTALHVSHLLGGIDGALRSVPIAP